MTTNNHPAHGPVSLDRLHQIREILSKAEAQSDGGNLGYAMADAVKVIDGVIAAFGAEPVAWLHSDNGIGIPAITKSRNVADSWFSKGWNIKPLYTSPPAPVVPDEMYWQDAPVEGSTRAAAYATGWNAYRAAMLQSGALTNEDTKFQATKFKPVADLYGITSPTGSETSFTFDAGEASSFAKGGWAVQEYVELERYQQAVAGNSPATPDGWVMVPKEMTDAIGEAIAMQANCCGGIALDIYDAMLAAAPQQ
ncbi:hypothetical protein RQM40_05785 [Citrobacter portucalensis]|uniref:hypothetical protein n=1 Tax=Citrobacter portucalensis TaxID=1639133 RepID=UPI003896B2C1